VFGFYHEKKMSGGGGGGTDRFSILENQKKTFDEKQM
jgi:hypothetical protein